MEFTAGGDQDHAGDPVVGRRGRRTSSETRAHLVAVATEMFHAYGIHATGVDALAARAGVAPTTLYRLFASKDELVAAYVEHCSQRYRRSLADAAGPSSGTPRERILAVFAAFAQELGSGSCRGCPFLMALAEYPDPGNPVHAVAVAHKTWLRELFRSLAAEYLTPASSRGPDELADQLTLVADGVYGSFQALGPTGPVAHGRALVEALLDAAFVPAPAIEAGSR